MISSSNGDLLVGGKFRLVKKIGSGSFGDIYRGINITTKKEVAIKLESSTVGNPQLLDENKVYEVLQGGLGVPRIHWFGRDLLAQHEYNILVMDLLGPSLEDLFQFCSRRFTMKTILMLADQMIQRIEFMHSKCFIHRDLKPDNFLMGVDEKCNVLYLIDLGLAKKFKAIESGGSNRSGQHIAYMEGKSLVGTARYVSLNAHLGREQSRRDDMASLGYLLIYFDRGSLPWQGVKAETKKQKYEKIKEKKMSMSEEELCRGLPVEFILYLNYCRSLGFYERPDYKYLRQLFKDLFERLNYQNDNKFDWTVLKELGITRKDCEKKIRSEGDMFAC